jgi:hypothetical protein
MSNHTSLSDPLPELKEFVFEKKLGSGTYACVYRVYNKVKMINHPWGYYAIIINN